MKLIRVMIVDDHLVVREGLKKLLGLEEDIEIVGEASSGLVGSARKDGTNGAHAVGQFLGTQSPKGSFSIEALEATLAKTGKRFVNKADWKKLDKFELAEADHQGVPSFRFGSNREMIAVIDSEKETVA